VHEARVTSTLPYIRDVPHSSLFRMRKGSYSRTSTLRVLVAATCHLRARMRTRRPRVDVDLRDRSRATRTGSGIIIRAIREIMQSAAHAREASSRASLLGASRGARTGTWQRKCKCSVSARGWTRCSLSRTGGRVACAAGALAASIMSSGIIARPSVPLRCKVAATWRRSGVGDSVREGYDRAVNSVDSRGSDSSPLLA